MAYTAGTASCEAVLAAEVGPDLLGLSLGLKLCLRLQLWLGLGLGLLLGLRLGWSLGCRRSLGCR